MLQALLHGKLGCELKRDAYEIEDLLTSVVVGTCAYLDPHVALLPFLGHARDVDGRAFDTSSVTAVQYKFWPPLEGRRTPQAEGATGEPEPIDAEDGEPEVLLTLTRRDGSVGMLLLEAKLLSGKSSRPSPTGPVRDQLGKYWLQLGEAAQVVSAEPLGVVYITRGLTLPRDEFAETQAELVAKGKQPSAKLYWLSWRAFGNAARSQAAHHQLLADVVELLETRWSLVDVKMLPWSTPPRLTAPWRYLVSWTWRPLPTSWPTWRFDAGRSGG